MIAIVTGVFIAIATYISASASADVTQKAGKQVTLSYWKANLVSNDYIFRNRAEKECAEGYEILGKNPNPEDEKKEDWVIECR